MKKEIERQLTQYTKIRNMLSVHGEVNNLWAINHGIWRLSEYIRRLRDEGWCIDREYMIDKKGKKTHVSNYKLSKSKK